MPLNDDEAQPPHLFIDHNDFMPDEMIDEFQSIINYKNLVVSVNKRKTTLYASAEWFIPTAIVLYISKPYFESFLREMGKDHYQLLKKGIKHLWSKARSIPVKYVVSGKKKVSQSNPYSLHFTIQTTGENSIFFKFMFEKNLNDDAFEETLQQIMKFLINFHDENLNSETIEALSKNTPLFGRVVLLTYDVKQKQFIILDPKEKEQASQSNAFRINDTEQ